MEEFINIIECENKFHNKELLKYLYKVNTLYINNKLQKYLHNGVIDYLIGDALDQWDKLSSWENIAELKIRHTVYDYDYLRQDITQALMESNIIFYERYTKLVKYQNYFYRNFNYLFVRLFKANHFNSISKKLKFKKFSIFDAFVFRLNFITIGYRRYYYFWFKTAEEYEKFQKYHGYNIKYDVPMELYKGDLSRIYYSMSNQRLYSNMY